MANNHGPSALRQALMETVNSSSSALLQKLDLTQQDLLKQSKESHQVLETVASNQGAFSKQLESGHEFTRKRLVEMEGTLEQQISHSGAEMRSCQVEKAEALMQHIQTELAGLGKWCQAMVNSTEQATKTQEERMIDVRRQTMLIMDIVTSTQDAITQSSESLQSFTHSQYMNNSSANMETNLREVIMHEMAAVKNSLLGMEDTKEVNLKSAICAMVDRLNEGVKRLELASDISASGLGAGDEMRMELANVAQVLAQQQQQVTTQSLQQVSEILQSELSSFRDSQSVQTAQISDSLTEKVSTFSEQVNQNLARVEASLDKILEAKAESGRKARADRG
eukprot:s1453_g14.t1